MKRLSRKEMIDRAKQLITSCDECIYESTNDNTLFITSSYLTEENATKLNLKFVWKKVK